MLQSFQINMVKNHTVFERKNLAVISIERAFFILNKNFYCWKQVQRKKSKTIVTRMIDFIGLSIKGKITER